MHTQPLSRSIVGGLFNPLIKKHRGSCNPISARRVMWWTRCVRNTWRRGKGRKRNVTIHAFHHHHAQLTTWQSPSHDNNMQSTTHFSCTISDVTSLGQADTPVDQRATKYGGLTAVKKKKKEKRKENPTYCLPLPVPADTINLRL